MRKFFAFVFLLFVLAFSGTLFFLASCQATETLDEKTQAVTGTCVTAESYGAIAGDGLDDRAAIQSAVDAAQLIPGGCLRLGAGRYDVAHRGIAGAVNAGSIRIRGPIDIVGAGRGATTIAMLGSPYRSATEAGAWYLLELRAGAQNVTVSGLSLTGADRIGTSEQTHLISMRGVTHARVERVDMHLQPLALAGSGVGATGGDCVNMVGTSQGTVPLTPNGDVTLSDIHATYCDRSFVAVQRYNHDVTIERITVDRVDDQAIDFEPTAGVCLPLNIYAITIRDSVFARGATAQGDVSIAINGGSCALASDIDIERVTLPDGGISVSEVDGVRINAVTLVAMPANANGNPAAAPLQILKRAEGVIVSRLGITRPVYSGFGNSIYIAGTPNKHPGAVRIIDTTIAHETDGVPIKGVDLRSLTIAGGSIRYTGPSTDIPWVRVDADLEGAGAPVIVDLVVMGARGAVIADAVGISPAPAVVVRSRID